jgi:hypothetical protein
LVIGLHRLKAAMKLGWTQIRATAHGKMTNDEADLAEIDENLCRSELSPAERANHIGLRKAIYERQHPTTKHGAAPGAGRGKKKSPKEPKLGSFGEATAKATGQSKTKIKRDAKRHKELGALLDKINGTCLDTGVEMDALAKLPEAEQEALVARAAAGEKVSAKAVLAAKKSGAKSAPGITGSAQTEIDPEARKAANAKQAGETLTDDLFDDLLAPRRPGHDTAPAPVDEARQDHIKACMDEAAEKVMAAHAAIAGAPLPADSEPTEQPGIDYIRENFVLLTDCGGNWYVATDIQFGPFASKEAAQHWADAQKKAPAAAGSYISGWHAATDAKPQAASPAPKAARK